MHFESIRMIIQWIGGLLAFGALGSWVADDAILTLTIFARILAEGNKG